MKYKKNILLLIVLIIITIDTLFVINNKQGKTFKYNGSIIALTVNGEVTNTFPSKGLYKIDINCENAQGIWDIDNWKLDIKNITGNVSCNVSFDDNPPLLTNIVNTDSTSGIESGNGLMYKSNYGVRYKGNNPNNYIWYNNDLYRIIGNIPACTSIDSSSKCTNWENRIKLIRANILGDLIFMVGSTQATSSSTWLGSTLEKNLNECFLGKKNNQTDETCASYCYSYYSSTSSYAKSICNYSKYGIEVGGEFYDMIADNIYWNVGIHSASEKCTEQYEYEKTLQTSEPLKIGLMSGSDYICSKGTQLDNTGEKWMYIGYEWAMNGYKADAIFRIIPGNSLGGATSNMDLLFRPTLYLKPNVVVISGDGSEENPYKIMLGN